MSPYVVITLLLSSQNRQFSNSDLRHSIKFPRFERFHTFSPPLRRMLTLLMAHRRNVLMLWARVIYLFPQTHLCYQKNGVLYVLAFKKSLSARITARTSRTVKIISIELIFSQSIRVVSQLDPEVRGPSFTEIGNSVY